MHFDRGRAAGWLPRWQVPPEPGGTGPTALAVARAMVTHCVVAWVAASAALYACALMVASTRQRDALSPAGVMVVRDNLSGW